MAVWVPTKANFVFSFYHTEMTCKYYKQMNSKELNITKWILILVPLNSFAYSILPSFCTLQFFYQENILKSAKSV